MRMRCGSIGPNPDLNLPAAFAVDPVPARATTLPPAFYLDPAVFAAVREQVFARRWQWLGDLAAVEAAGTLAPRTLLPGLLDEPLLLARDAAGSLRCLSSVCTHRGLPCARHPLPPTMGAASSFRAGCGPCRVSTACPTFPRPPTTCPTCPSGPGPATVLPRWSSQRSH
jgi:hypothetical protein